MAGKNGMLNLMMMMLGEEALAAIQDKTVESTHYGMLGSCLDGPAYDGLLTCAYSARGVSSRIAFGLL